MAEINQVTQDELGSEINHQFAQLAELIRDHTGATHLLFLINGKFITFADNARLLAISKIQQQKSYDLT